jgi:hypothetical protein
MPKSSKKTSKKASYKIVEVKGRSKPTRYRAVETHLSDRAGEQWIMQLADCVSLLRYLKPPLDPCLFLRDMGDKLNRVMGTNNPFITLIKAWVGTVLDLTPTRADDAIQHFSNDWLEFLVVDDDDPIAKVQEMRDLVGGMIVALDNVETKIRKVPSDGTLSPPPVLKRGLRKEAYRKKFDPDGAGPISVDDHDWVD